MLGRYGRATIQCLKHHAKRVYAIEPPRSSAYSATQTPVDVASQRLITRIGRFRCFALDDQCVDVALSCSAFTAMMNRVGLGLANQRVQNQMVRLFDLARPQDRAWLVAHGFTYVALPVQTGDARSFSLAACCLRMRTALLCSQ